jgi:hypothetical protein
MAKKSIKIVGRVFISLVFVGAIFISTACSNEEKKKPTPPPKPETIAVKPIPKPAPPPKPKPPPPKPKPQPESYSKLELVEIIYDGTQVVISGSTDLPNGSVLSVRFDVWGRPGSALDISVSAKASVSKGKFKVKLSPPQRKEFKRGPYEVSVLFTPRAQSDAIKKIVGKKGEKLTGNLVDDKSYSFKLMRLVEKSNIKLKVKPPTYTFQKSTKFKKGSPERVLADYVWAWKNKRWSTMAKYATKTWLSKEKDPKGLLQAWYGFKTLKGFEIVNVETVSSTMTDVTFIVQYEFRTNIISKKKITARVIKESAPYTMSESGRWGVNPTSAIREEDVE